MSLSPGTRLGPYEIVGTAGAGGMGDVYKARDTRLDRTVAIKVVRTDFSERFEREARLLLCVGGANNVLWTYDLERNTPTRLTFRFDTEAATWSHDGSHVTYWSGSEMRSVRADGSGKDEVLIAASEAGGRNIRPGNWSADGEKPTPPLTEIRVVLNWAQTLPRR